MVPKLEVMLNLYICLTYRVAEISVDLNKRWKMQQNMCNLLMPGKVNALTLG